MFFSPSYDSLVVYKRSSVFFIIVSKLNQSFNCVSAFIDLFNISRLNKFYIIIEARLAFLQFCCKVYSFSFKCCGDTIAKLATSKVKINFKLKSCAKRKPKTPVASSNKIFIKFPTLVFTFGKTFKMLLDINLL